MKHFVPQLPVQREVPTGMVAQHLDGLPVRHPVDVLQETDSQHHHRLNRRAPILRTIALLQGGARPRQARVNQLGEEPVTVAWGKEAGGQPRRGEEPGLGGEAGQAHRRGPRTANEGLTYG